MMCYDVTCRYGASTGNTGLPCAASCCCCDEPDILEPAAWHLNLLHIRLVCDGNDGFKLGATDSGHRDGLHWFNVLKIIGHEGKLFNQKDKEKLRRASPKQLSDRFYMGKTTPPAVTWSRSASLLPVS